MYVVLRAHPIRGESHIQHNTTGEVASATAPISMQVIKSDCKPKFLMIACSGLVFTMKLSAVQQHTYFLLVEQVSYI